MQDDQSGWLVVGELAGQNRIFPDDRTLGNDQADRSRCWFVGQFLPDPEDGAGVQHAGDTGHPDSKQQETRPLNGAGRPTARYEKATEQTIGMKWRNFD